MSIHRVAFIVVVGLVVHGPVNRLLAQCELQKLVSSTGTSREYFGYSVDISGDQLVVGVPNNQAGGMLSGTALVFGFDGTEWVQEGRLRPDSQGPLHLFGHSVSVTNEWILVGVPGAILPSNLQQAGAAYLFRLAGLVWVQEAMVVPSSAISGGLFGWSTDISNDVAVVGAPRAGGVHQGEAYVLRYDGTEWGEEEKLLASDQLANAQFGVSVGVSGDVVVVGSWFDWATANAAGSVYVFRHDGVAWVEEAKLLPADLGIGDNFGWTVDISGDTLVAGAPGDDDSGAQSGSAYIFHFDGTQWVEEAKLLPPAGAPHEYFGYAASISGDTAVVGAHFNGANGQQAGLVYVYQFNGTDWVLQAELLASDGAAGDYLGRAVGISGTTIVAGAPRDDDQGTQSGSVYVFDSCPAGAVPDHPVRTAYREPDAAIAPPFDPPPPWDQHMVRGGMPGRGGAAAALVREESYGYFMEEVLQTHFGDDRGNCGPERHVTRQNIAATFSSYGLSVTLEPFTFWDETQYNVVGTLWGSTYPDEEYVIGAHFDSADNGGADDNASGTALVLEAARVLSRYESQRTIRFVAFDMEERGLIGGYAYVADHSTDNILGMVSTDMVAYYNGEDLFNIGWGPASSGLESALLQAASEYGDALVGAPIGQTFGSDHAPFEEAGFQSCYFGERELTPWYHSLFDNTDVLGVLDYGYASQLTRVIVGFLVDNAGIDTCVTADPIVRDPELPNANRFISFTSGNVGQRTAIRVKLIDLYHPDPAPPIGGIPDFTAFEGEYRWVGPPAELPELNEVGPPFTEPTWTGAMLRCEPYFADWSSLGTMLHVYGAEIMPESTYEVQEVLEVCAGRLDDESLYSTAVQIDTGRWGDVTALYAGAGNPPQPDFIDIAAIVAKFVGALDPTKVEAMLRLNVLPVTEGINFKDIAACVEGFVQTAYPYDGPCACPSAATCPDLDVCGRCGP